VPRAQQLKMAYEAVEAPILALMPIKPADASRYGVPVVEEDEGGGRLRIRGLVEKPKPDEAPSAYAAIGGYVITPGIIEELEETTRRWYQYREGEVYLTDALHSFATNNPVYGQVITGTWWDTGSPINYLKAQFAAALAHREYGPELRQFLTTLPED
jgi:UTP--glucose-1-phosphate uridylyltransferase